MADPVNPAPADPAATPDSPSNVTPDSSTPDSPATPVDPANPTPDSPPADPAQTPAPADTPADPAPFVDPMDNLLDDGDKGESRNLTGDKHLEVAAQKKFEEIQDGVATGDPAAIKAFRQMKPKTQELVAKKFSLNGQPVESAKEMLDFLEAEHGAAPAADPAASFTDKDGEVIKANLNVKFRDQAEAAGLKFEELKKSGEYEAVVKSAKKTIDFIKANNLPSSSFDQLFDFDQQFAVATLQVQKDNAYQEGAGLKDKINNANNTSPQANANHQPNGVTPPATSKVAKADYYNSTDAKWRADYRANHEQNGVLDFTDS